MRIRKLRVAALSLLTLLIGVAAASATTVTNGAGTEGQVKPACVPAMEYAEGTDDECANSGSVPKSLIEPVTGSIGDVTPPPPPPPPAEDEGEIK